MIRNLIVYINSDRSVFPKELKIANQFEIKTNEIKFIFDGDIPRTGYPYLILTNRNGSFYLPLVDDSVVFGSQETWIMGGWSAHIMISQAEIINGIVNKSEKLFISDDFGLWVEPSDINIDDLKEQQIPTPLKLLYDDLFALKERVEEILDGGLSDGKDGVDGVSPTVSVSKSGKVTTITINDVEGTKTATINDGLDGKDGSNGQNGKDGTSVTVFNVSESTADGGSNVVTFSDGKSITIKNGSKGSKGDSGQDGADGHTPVKGVDYFDGQNGKDGQDGKDGVSISSVTQTTTSSEDGGTNIVQVTLSNGNKSSFQVKNGSKGSKGDKGDTGPTGPAYTLTASDKAAITASVKSEIDPELDELKESIGDYETLTLGVHSDGKIYLFKNGSPVGTGVETGSDGDVVGYIDSSNNIVLSGTLAEGTYTVKYEMEDGTLVEIGTLENVDKPKYTNLANPSDSYWQEGYRLSISSGNTSALAKHTTTNFIPCKKGDVLRVKGLNILGSIGGSSDYADFAKIVAYNSSKTKINGLYGGSRSSTSADQDFGLKVTKNGDITTYTILVDNLGAQRADTTTAYIRIDGGLMSGYTKNDVIITINQEITD